MKPISPIEANQILTKGDFQEYLKLILEAIAKIQSNNVMSTSSIPRYYRTREVRKILSVSANKLSNMRFKGEIPFRKIGKTYFYPADRIHSLLK